MNLDKINTPHKKLKTLMTEIKPFNVKYIPFVIVWLPILNPGSIPQLFPTTLRPIHLQRHTASSNHQLQIQSISLAVDSCEMLWLYTFPTILICTRRFRYRATSH